MFDHLNGSRGEPCFLPLLAVVVWGLALAPALAQEFIVDQANDEFAVMVCHGIVNGTPIGQEFTPLLDRVDVVELWIQPGLDSLFQVLIRDDTIDGEVLGAATTTVDAPDFSGSVARFEFPEPVSVVSGDRYVMQVLALQGFYGMLGVGVEDGTNVYPGGRYIRWGETHWTMDAWFREGVWALSGTQASTWSSVKSLFR